MAGMSGSNNVGVPEAVVSASQSLSDVPDLETVCRQHGLDHGAVTKLGEAADEMKEQAYCPYSKFRVGAALLTQGSHSATITGCNIENASYPVGTCAERVALAKAISDGHRRFAALAVSTDIDSPASPCGMCRQFINEFCESGMPVFMLGRDGWKGDWKVMTLGELLPMSFRSADLPRPPTFAEAQGLAREVEHVKKE